MREPARLYPRFPRRSYRERRRLARQRRSSLLKLLPLLLLLLSPPLHSPADSRAGLPAPAAGFTPTAATPAATATETAPAVLAGGVVPPEDIAQNERRIQGEPGALPASTPVPTSPPRLLNPTAEQVGATLARPAAALSRDQPLNSLPQQPAPPTAVPGTVSVLPILMYHYVREVDAASDPTGYNLSVAPGQFAAQLDWLAEQGYTPIRMDQAIRCLHGEAGCPARPVALTFDDGYMDAYTTALPLLRQHGFVATFYIVSGFIGHEGYMGWHELEALRDAGMEIGAHSLTHPDLTMLEQAAAAVEIGQSRQQLADQLQVPITSFCYPAGKFTAATSMLVQEAGYTNATTTMQGADYSNAYLLPRLRIDNSIELDGFAWLVQTYTP